MRRFYSLLLTAAFLLVGMNVSAKDLVGSDWAALQGAVNAIMNGTESDPVITLQSPVLLTTDQKIWIGTADLDAASYKTITLDLNGFNITKNATRDSQNKLVAATMFVLTHGELIVTNSAADQASIELLGESSDATMIFAVYGSYRSSRWNEAGNALAASGVKNTRDANGGWCSHLYIDDNVKIYAEDGCQGTGIAIDNNVASSYKTTATTTTTLNYTTRLKVDKDASYGFAFGVRVDVFGDIEVKGTDTGKSYGIKTNGTLRSPMSGDASEIITQFGSTNVPYLQSYNTYNGTDTATNKVSHRLDTTDVPFVYVDNSATIVSREKGSKSTAIYASGYAKWLVKGTCEGKTAVYVSSGDIDLHDAQITSTAETYTNPISAGSANGGGSGIVVNSRTSYAGDIDITISGDTKVEGAEGYAIEEVVNTVDHNTKVENITIDGGTIQNGDLGAIALSSNDKTVVVAGNIQGVITENGTTKPLSSYVSSESHMTEVVDEYNNTIYVVSEGATSPTEGNYVSNQAEGASVKWITNTTDAIVDGHHLKLTELEINTNNLVQTLTIEAGATLEVGRVVLGKDARIIVEAGGKFIVTGKDGIVAPVTNNIVLRHNSAAVGGGKYATFIFNPSVTFNRHPNATVEFTSKSWRESSALKQWEWFGVPTYNAIKSIAATCPAYIQVFENNAWTEIGLVSDISASEALREKMNKPFAAYDLLAKRDRTDAAPTITITGELVGNVNATLKADRKWSPFANSYTAEVDAEAFVNGLSGNIADAIYLAKQNNNGTITWNLKTDDLLKDLKLQPMQAFLLLNNGAVEEAAINYTSMVYNPATIPANSGAPSRFVEEENTTKVTINVANENGTWDDVDLRENGKIKAYEKYLNDDVNIYVVDGEKNDYVAAEDLENTYVGFSTVNGGNFTISFAKAEGREFDLIDLETGARVAVSEGETYSFSAAANFANDYRFKLVERAKLPTAIENTEVKANVKGIYTITGQYLGEMNVWNTLPAGVYVVNGAKMVK